MPPEQGDGFATNLEQGEVGIGHSSETSPKDVARWAEVLGESSRKKYVASKASNSVGPSANKKKTKTTPEASNWKRGTNVSHLPTRPCNPPLLKKRPELCLLEPFWILKLLLNHEICNLIITAPHQSTALHCTINQQSPLRGRATLHCTAPLNSRTAPINSCLNVVVLSPTPFRFGQNCCWPSQESQLTRALRSHKLLFRSAAP